MTADTPLTAELERTLTSVVASMHLSGLTVAEVEQVWRPVSWLRAASVSLNTPRRVDTQQE